MRHEFKLQRESLERRIDDLRFRLTFTEAPAARQRLFDELDAASARLGAIEMGAVVYSPMGTRHNRRADAGTQQPNGHAGANGGATQALAHGAPRPIAGHR
jgi:hypothetical protein